MKMTSNTSEIILVLKDGQHLNIDGKIKDHFDLDDERMEVTFVFDKEATNLPKLKELAIGSVFVPVYEMIIDKVDYIVFAIGATNDIDTEITSFIVRK